jgi:hypothetical protein
MDQNTENDVLQNIEGSAVSDRLEPYIQHEIFSSFSEVLRLKTWAILDIEYIQTSSVHKCIRKIYMLEKGTFSNLELEFSPCVKYNDMGRRYQKSFRFCRTHIHKLPYNPEKRSSPCSTATEKIHNFITENGVEIILYKGGNIEKSVCDELQIPSMNIEEFGVVKASCHDPRLEVHSYYEQLLKFL